MTRKSLIALIALGGVAHQLYADKAYVTNAITTPGSVSIFNTATNTVTGTVTDLLAPTFDEPNYVIFTPNGQTAYVANLGITPNTISIINAATDSVTGTVTDMTTANFSLIRSLGITPDGTKMYVVAPNEDAVGIVSLATNTYTGNVDATLFPFDSPRFIAITPDGTKAYVTSQDNNSVRRIDVATDTVDLSIAVTAPDAIIISPDGTRLYVGVFGGNSVVVIDVATNTIEETISASSISSASDLILSRDGNTLYILNSPVAALPADRGVITVYDLVNGEVITTIVPASTTNNSDFLAFASDYNTLYLTNQDADSVSIINPATNTFSGTVDDPDDTFDEPFAIAMVPALAATPSATGGAQIQNIFLTQTEFVNVLNWAASSGSPVSYAVYRDAALTDLAGTTSARVLAFQDHDRDPNTTYTYYVVAVDQNGAVSSPVVITVNPA